MKASTIINFIDEVFSDDKIPLDKGLLKIHFTDGSSYGYIRKNVINYEVVDDHTLKITDSKLTDLINTKKIKIICYGSLKETEDVSNDGFN